MFHMEPKLFFNGVLNIARSVSFLLFPWTETFILCVFTAIAVAAAAALTFAVAVAMCMAIHISHNIPNAQTYLIASSFYLALAFYPFQCACNCNAIEYVVREKKTKRWKKN